MDRYDLLSYPVWLRSGTAVDGAVSVDASAPERDRDRRATYSVALAVGVVVVRLWGVAVFLGLGYVGFTAMTAMGPTNEVVETECRAVPAGDGERVVAAHEQAVARRRRLAGVGVLVAVTLGVTALAGPPEGLVASPASPCCSPTGP